MSASSRLSHFFHVVSNIRPIVWIGLYVCLTPIFATIYWALPDGQFRIPDDAGTDWGSWFYYSIVTITTLGFGDYTPAHGWAQAVTAVEVMCGLVFLGFFLNAVGSMKSEIDVESEIEKQRRAHYALEKEKLVRSVPQVIHALNIFLSYCYAVTTPVSRRSEEGDYNPGFSFSDMVDLFKPSGLVDDHSALPAVARLMKSAANASLALDSLQTRTDLTLWPQLLEDCFGFVASYQMFSNSEIPFDHPSVLKFDASPGVSEEELSSHIASMKGEPRDSSDPVLKPLVALYYFIKENADLASKIETAITSAANSSE